MALVAFLLLSATALAGSEKEGEIVRIEPDIKRMVIQGNRGDRWDLYGTETTKLDDGVTIEQLRTGDKIDFDYVEREGKMCATKIEREKKAER